MYHGWLPLELSLVYILHNEVALLLVGETQLHITSKNSTQGQRPQNITCNHPFVVHKMHKKGWNLVPHNPHDSIVSASSFIFSSHSHHSRPCKSFMLMYTMASKPKLIEELETLLDKTRMVKPFPILLLGSYNSWCNKMENLTINFHGAKTNL